MKSICICFLLTGFACIAKAGGTQLKGAKPPPTVACVKWTGKIGPFFCAPGEEFHTFSAIQDALRTHKVPFDPRMYRQEAMFLLPEDQVAKARSIMHQVEHARGRWLRYAGVEKHNSKARNAAVTSRIWNGTLSKKTP
jgi:hypothetical protein